MNYFKSAIAYTAFFISFFSVAQSYVGHSIDNYSGIHGVIDNPSNIVDSRFKTDVNLASASTFIGSDYYAIDFGNIFNEDIDIEDNSKISPSDSNNFFSNAEVVGPSFMFNLNDTNSVGIVTRLRGFANINNINGSLFESLNEEFENAEDFSFDSSNLVSTYHVWAEIGFAYGRVLYNNEDHFLKGGITLKLLQGAGISYFNSPGFSGNYDASAQTITTNGSINYGNIDDINNDEDFNFDNLQTGFGADLGVTYEWRKGNDTDSKGFNKYVLKLGLAITDIGSITYKNIKQYSFDLNNQTESTIGYNDTEAFLDENYTSVETTKKLKINLPTALRLSADYHVDKSIYVSVLGAFSMVKNNTEYANKINNAVTLSPRIETKWFSFYSPVSFRQYDDFAWGAGLRLGPLTVGSGSILSNVLSKESKTTDIYLGLKVPIYQSKKTK
ncbi:DUF5723 family protein [Olleya marilimosa]|uniref:DUF5723 family protein n=1 Tax=Olleya marilimosa TaxID=272164 RepID=UPI0030EC966E|tara:strand:- start:94646 stop:95974 length:1329 start_codon:yes stop_codon:yes gene_type:complete